MVNMALALAECVLTPSFNDLVVPGVGWIFFMLAELLGEADRSVGLTMELGE